MPASFSCRAAGACLALLVAVSAVSAPAWAQDPGAPESGPQEARVRPPISEDAAVAMVREQTDGKVVRVDRKTESGALVYHIRVLSPDGRLREFQVNATTGALR
jgi:uncharacterized membrane protein YkoI